MKNSIKIIKAISNDAEILSEISKRAFESDVEVGAPKKGGFLGYDSVETHRKHLKSKRIKYLKILFDGKIVGGIKIIKTYPRQYGIFDVFIDPGYHRKGIGKKSIEMIQQMYPDVKRWTLDTPVWNIRTKSFYEKLGFNQYGVMRWESGSDNELRAYELITDSQYKLDLKSIGNLSDGMKFVIVEGLILCDPTPMKRKSKNKEKSQKILYTMLSDDSGSVKLILLDKMHYQIKSGERVRIDAGYITSSGDEIMLNVNKFGRVIILF